MHSLPLPRLRHLKEVKVSLGRFPVVALVGSRQSGKTTLAGLLAESRKGKTHWFDLENPQDAAVLAQPGLSLPGLKGLVVIDEVQRLPNLFPLLRVLADRKPLAARFLVLGSASGDLMRQGSESLAGRIQFHELPGLSLEEVEEGSAKRLWHRGGYPKSFLARRDSDSLAWRSAFIDTFLEHDIPSLGLRLPAPQMRRFWIMAAHYHGQTWNSSEIGRSLGLSDKTMLHYLQILEQSFMVRLLPPWYENVSKRLVKSPKFYIRDSGLFHTLLGITDEKSLLQHPKLGASWEGFALEEVIKITGSGRNAFFWGTHGGAELDLLITQGNRRIGFEFKYSQAPSYTKSMHAAMADLNLSRLAVVYPGTQIFPLGEKVDAVPLSLLKEWL
ncbi:MAG: ATP-binding protein [Fibrobacterota bacterium]|nr:ATP-binding protein [Fibrobacterota bacterium]